MEKSKKEQAAKLQIRLDKLLETKEKKQIAFEKSKKELNEVSKNIESVKLKLFEILQNDSDDIKFSNWAKRKINENVNHENSKNSEMKNHQSHKSQNSNNENSEKSETQNHKQFKLQNLNE
jgi:hypothetical protein